jgi:hypothetical protein
MVLNSLPTNLSGVQLTIPIFLSGRQTRLNSLAACSWFGVNMTPNVERTTSKLASVKGRASASACRNVTAKPSAWARWRPAIEKRADVVRRYDFGDFMVTRIGNLIALLWTVSETKRSV